MGGRLRVELLVSIAEGCCCLANAAMGPPESSSFILSSFARGLSVIAVK